MKPMQCRLLRIWKVLTRKSWTANFGSSQLSFVIWIGNFTIPVCLTSIQVQNTPGYSTPPQSIRICSKFIRMSSYMVSTQYLRTRTRTRTRTSTGPNKCPNQAQDCVSFNGKDQDWPGLGLVLRWPEPVPGRTSTRTSLRPGPRHQYWPGGRKDGGEFNSKIC